MLVNPDEHFQEIGAQPVGMVVKVGMMTHEIAKSPFINLIAGFHLDWSHFPKGFDIKNSKPSLKWLPYSVNHFCCWRLPLPPLLRLLPHCLRMSERGTWLPPLSASTTPPCPQHWLSLPSSAHQDFERHKQFGDNPILTYIGWSGESGLHFFPVSWTEHADQSVAERPYLRKCFITLPWYAPAKLRVRVWAASNFVTRCIM